MSDYQQKLPDSLSQYCVGEALSRWADNRIGKVRFSIDMIRLSDGYPGFEVKLVWTHDGIRYRVVKSACTLEQAVSDAIAKFNKCLIA